MDISEVEGMNMVKEQDHLINHRWGEEDIQMVEVEDMDTVDEHYHLMNHRRRWRVWIWMIVVWGRI
jgi:hypothetical protein